MWNRAFMRLLSLSFMAFFIAGLLWHEGARDQKASAKKQDPDTRDGADADTRRHHR